MVEAGETFAEEFAEEIRQVIADEYGETECATVTANILVALFSKRLEELIDAALTARSS